MASDGAPANTVAIDRYGPAGRSAWMDVDWREHQRWVTVADRPVNVVDLGSGPPLVFVHGLAGSWQNWLENLPEFARDHRVIALDLPGFGHSPMPLQRISITGYAAIVDELLRTLGVPAATIVGNSMGGFVALDMALHHAQRVERLVLVAAAGVGLERAGVDRAVGVLRRAERLVLGYNAFIAARSDVASRRAGLRRQLLRMVAAHPEKLPAPLVSEQLRANGTAGFLDAVEALTTYVVRDRLQEIDAPTLIVWGEHDRLVPVADAGRLARGIPDARSIIYADTGHVAMLERPERFNADLRAFLAER